MLTNLGQGTANNVLPSPPAIITAESPLGNYQLPPPRADGSGVQHIRKRASRIALPDEGQEHTSSRLSIRVPVTAHGEAGGAKSIVHMDEAPPTTGHAHNMAAPYEWPSKAALRKPASKVTIMDPVDVLAVPRRPDFSSSPSFANRASSRFDRSLLSLQVPGSPKHQVDDPSIVLAERISSMVGVLDVGLDGHSSIYGARTPSFATPGKSPGAASYSLAGAGGYEDEDNAGTTHTSYPRQPSIVHMLAKEAKHRVRIQRVISEASQPRLSPKEKAELSDLLRNRSHAEWIRTHGRAPPLPKLPEEVKFVIRGWFELVDKGVHHAMRLAKCI